MTPDLTDIADHVAVLAAQAADDRGGTNIQVLNVSSALGICDWFVVISASNSRMVKAISDEVDRRVAEEAGVHSRSIEGIDARDWVLIDFGDVVVHIFDAEQRDFYRIERLFGDADRLDWQTTEEALG